MLPRPGPEAISPTAHYTGEVWSRNGLSHPALRTTEGRLMHAALRPALGLSGALGGPTLDAFLLARHRIIDERLEAAIGAGRVTAVVELACGLSPRGWRFARRHGAALTYVEVDLPAMADRKRRALAEIGTLGPRHRVEALDARDGAALDAVLRDLGGGVAVITEGLLNYLDRGTVEALWQRLAGQVELYLSDLVLAEAFPVVRAFTRGLSAFVGGPVHLHWSSDAAVDAALAAAGFADATLHVASRRPAVRVIEASSRR